jgi:phenylacetate-CoA ligase
MIERRDFYGRLVSSLLFPLHERLKGHASVALRRELEETQWWDAERIAALRTARLKAMLSKIERDVPYYQQRFAELGFAAADLRNEDDLSRLPLLDKATIRAHTPAMKAMSARGLIRYNTGGSSGEPLVFFIGEGRVSHDVAAKWRATRWWGVDIGDREAVVWGSPVELTRQDRLRKLRDRVLRTTLLPAFEMSPERLDAFVDALLRLRPRILFGYPSALAFIGRHARERGIDLRGIGVEVAFVTSEKLYEDQRRSIAETFGCRVADGYGGRDAGFIAHECPQGRLHLSAEDIVVEIVGNDGRRLPYGEAGEIVVTHTRTADFPFLRYRTGDIGVLSEERCACGRGLPVLARVEGRSTDLVYAADGTAMHGLALIYVLRDLEGIRQFRIVQESLGETRVEIVAGEGFGQNTSRAIEQGLRRRLGASVRVIVERVPRIATEASGKFRYVQSRVIPPEAQRAPGAARTAVGAEQA